MNLDVIQVAEPCTVDWNTMTGDERVRHCSLCQKNVYELSSLTKREAERLIVEHEGNLCVRFYRRADGTVQTSDCLPIRRRLALVAHRTRRRLTAVCSAFLAFAGFSIAASRLAIAAADSAPVAGGIAPPKLEPQPPMLMGRTMGIIAAPSTQPTTQPVIQGEVQYRPAPR